MSTYLAISPHLDDAALSFGAQLADLAAHGNDVVAYTVFAGRPRPPYSTVASDYHRTWAISDDPVGKRRAEDIKAMRILGVRPVHGDHLEAIYRKEENGSWLVGAGMKPSSIDLVDEPTLLGEVVEVIAGLIEHYRPERVLTCAALGRHVDHVRARDASVMATLRTGTPLGLWEDLPYGIWTRRSTPLPGGMTGDPVPITNQASAASWHAKALANQCYVSQLPMLSHLRRPVGELLELHACRRANEYGVAGRCEMSWSISRGVATP